LLIDEHGEEHDCEAAPSISFAREGITKASKNVQVIWKISDVNAPKAHIRLSIAITDPTPNHDCLF